MGVARAGASARPPVEVPTVLRRYLRFHKLPPAALMAARRALDADEVFRNRVRDAVAVTAEAEGGVESMVGRAGWLLLDRPAGWDDTLADLVAEAEQDVAAASHDHEERRATRQLVRTRLELDRARAAEAMARAETAEAQARATEIQDGHRAAEARVATQAERLDATEASRIEAVRQLKVAEHRLVERADEVRSLRTELEAVRTELEVARAEAATPSGPAVGTTETVSGTDTEGRPEARVEATATDRPSISPATAEPPLDRTALAAAVTAASRAAAALAEALAAATEVLATPGGDGQDDEPLTTVPPVGRGDEGGDGPGGRLGGGANRRPSPLPKGMFDDGADAALFLLRLPAAVVLVDGYNISMTGWPDQPLPVQRRRLVDGLRNLQARTGAEPMVVFDGAEPESGPSASLPRSVQVRFSPPGITADDVVVAMVEQLPGDRPVIVASSDREVRDRARQRGANTMSADQLVALLRDF